MKSEGPEGPEGRGENHDDFDVRAFEELLRRQDRRSPPAAWREAILGAALPGARGRSGWRPGFGGAGERPPREWRWFPRPLAAAVAVLWAAAAVLAWDAERTARSLPPAVVSGRGEAAPVSGDHPLRRHADLLGAALTGGAGRGIESGRPF